MDFRIYQLVLLILCFLFIYFWRTSHRFRYYAKYGYYYGLVQILALLCFFPAIFRPKDAGNIRTFQVVANVLFQLLGLTIVKRNMNELENLKEPAIIVVNHQNTIDVIAVMKVSPYKATFLAKKELMYTGLFGLTAWLSGLVFIDRLNPEHARGTMTRVVKTMHERQIKLWVFPEGTRHLNGGLLPFKKGAFHLAVQAQVPIYPVVVSSYQHFLDPKRKIFNCGKMITTLLPAVQTKGLTSDNVTELTEKVHAAMEEEFQKITKEVNEEACSRGSSIVENKNE